MYIDKLDAIINEYNNVYPRTIRMKPIEVKDNTYIGSIKGVNDKDPKFKVGDHARISKYKNIFGKGYTPNWSEEVFVVKETKNTVPWTYVINDLDGKQIKSTKKNQQRIRIETVIKSKRNKLYVEWKGYNSFNS